MSDRQVNPHRLGYVNAAMIVYDLVCTVGHGFEGWFGSAEAFSGQRERSLVRCPVCDTDQVERRPSAKVSVPKGGGSRKVRPVEAAPAQPADQSAAPAGVPAEAMAGLPPEVLAKLREIVKATENVGRRFPEEARKIHYEEVPARAIRGQASPEEAKALQDEGIEFAPLPPILTGESH